MDYEELSKKSLDEIMKAIREENGKNLVTSNVLPTMRAANQEYSGDFKIQRDAEMKAAEVFIDSAIVGTQIGFRKAPMYRKRGLARKFSRVIELIYLRIAELSHRDLRTFASSVISALRVLASRIESLFVNDQRLEDRMSAEIAVREEAIARLEEGNRQLREALEELRSDMQADKSALEELKSGVDEQLTSPSQIVNPFGQMADASGFYHMFEERFRGSRAEIVDRLEIYRPLLGEIVGSLEGKRCIDLGCGRGEMLDFYCKSGVSDRIGVDINPIQLEICRSNDHETVEMDCIAYLKSQPECSADMISAIQLVEHLPFASLVELLDEARRVLRPGGVILLETPNCDNLITATGWFYVDPSHIHPVNSEYLRFMAQRSGFRDIRIIGANPAQHVRKLALVSEENDNLRIINENMQQLNELLYGAQDYALIGVK